MRTLPDTFQNDPPRSLDTSPGDQQFFRPKDRRLPTIITNIPTSVRFTLMLRSALNTKPNIIQPEHRPLGRLDDNGRRQTFVHFHFSCSTFEPAAYLI